MFWEEKISKFILEMLTKNFSSKITNNFIYKNLRFGLVLHSLILKGTMALYFSRTAGQ